MGNGTGESEQSPIPFPIVPVFLSAFVLGSVWAAFGAIPLGAGSWYCAWLVSCVAFWFVARTKTHKSSAFTCFLVAAFCLGAGRMQDTQTPGMRDVSHWAGESSVWVRGRVVGDVDAGDPGDEHSSVRFFLATDAIDDFQQKHSVQGTLAVTVTADAKPGGNSRWLPAPGDTLYLRGRITEPPTATNPGAFDYRAYLARRSVFATFSARQSGDVRPDHARKSRLSLMQGAAALRQSIVQQTELNLSPDDAALLNGVLLGQRSRLPAAMDEAFARTGTVHVLSVSGLHLTAVASALALSLGLLPVSRRTVRAGAIVLLWLFALAAGFGAATVRAAIMVTLVLAAPLVGRIVSPAHSLCFAASLLLFAQPGALFDAGFQLSFAAMGALVLLWSPLMEWIAPWEPHVPLLIRGVRWASVVMR